MNRYDIMHAAFEDELTKIAGHIRIGRRPISAGRLLKKEGDMVKRSITDKLASVHTPGKSRTFLTGLAAGAAGLHIAKKMNDDRRLGRQVRLQQQS